MKMLHTLLIVFFCLGYLAIIFENFLHVNKAAVALVMSVICWLWLLFLGQPLVSNLIAHQIYDVAQIIFFLLAVMVIVELIDSHQGFKIVTDVIYSSSKKKMLWFLLLLSFFMSSILDNLTSMIVVASLLRKMVPNTKDRWLIGSMVVLAVNAGGAWTPIGDVTTTMLWINERITTWETIKWVFFPSVINTVACGLIGTFLLKGEHQDVAKHFQIQSMEPGARRVFVLGLISLVTIPFWKAVLGVPPFMGALLGLGLMWLITDIMHFRYGEERWHLRVLHVLTKIDFSGIFFFLGILLAIDALQMAGILSKFADLLNTFIGDVYFIAILIGLISSVIDNVPLVAASMGMYNLTQYPTDSILWQLIAYAAGTGGSILIIGSAAGVVFMGMEKIDFLWYLRKISWIALIGYFVGIGTYALQLLIFT